MKIFENKIVVTVIIIAVMFLSIFGVGSFMSKPSTYSYCSDYIEDRSDSVIELAGAAAVASSAITILPGDVGTPIADEIADFATYFLIILSALYLEKYLLVITGIAAYRIIIPIGCIFAIWSIWSQREELKKQAIKVCLFGLLLNAVIPGSVAVSKLIENQYHDSIKDTITLAEESAQIIQETEGESSWWDKLTNAYDSATDYLEDILNNFVEATAVMLVTSCVIPVLVLIFFWFLLKLFFGIEIRRPSEYLNHLHGHEKRAEE